MRMYATGSTVRALWWSMFLSVVMLSQVAAMVLAASQRDAVGIFPAIGILEIMVAFFALVIVVLLWRIPRNLMRTQRTLRAALRGDDVRAPRTLAPLDPQGALGPGEQITLTRTRALPAFWQSVRPVFTLVLIIIALGSIAPAFYAPAASTALDALLPGIAQWSGLIAYGIVLLPVALGIVLLLSGLLEGLQNRQITITADERGISQQNGIGRTRFIPWDDIHAIVRASGLQSDPLLNQYALWGERHGVTINLTHVGELILPQQALKPMTTYSGGRDRYVADARRLLATIAARTNVPLRVYAAGYYAAKPRRPTALAVGLTTADLTALPAALPPVPPPSPFIQQMLATTGRLTLAARTNTTLIQASRIVLLATLGIDLGVTVFTATNNGLSIGTLQTLLDVLYASFGGLLVGLILSIIGRRQVRKTALLVATTDQQALRLVPNLTMLAQRRGIITIPWGRIRAWGLISPAPSAPNDAIYVLLWDGPTVAWVERAGSSLAVPGLTGDARDAYRQVAEALRATVAERTGLAPKLLPQPRSRGGA